MNQQERDKLRAEQKRVMGIRGATPIDLSFTISVAEVVSVLEQVPVLLDEVERLAGLLGALLEGHWCWQDETDGCSYCKADSEWVGDGWVIDHKDDCPYHLAWMIVNEANNDE